MSESENQKTNSTILQKLFSPPFSDRINKVLPILFNMVELENMRGKKLGMEVGTARERVLIALFIYAFEGYRVVKFPASTSHGSDVFIKDEPISIKTKLGSSNSGVKLVWTVDWTKVNKFCKSYSPASDMLFVSINWNTEKGGFFVFPRSLQQDIMKDIGREAYLKKPKQGTNPRGVEMSALAMRKLRQSNEALHMKIDWKREDTVLGERRIYERWVDLWDTLVI